MGELYRGVRITIGVVCFSIVYFIDSELFRFFDTEEKAKRYIDEEIYMDLANKWLKENEKQFMGVEFSKEALLEIGKNIDNI